MNESREQIISWLKSAHAMEKSVEQNLEHHVNDAGDHPEIQQRLRTHLEETRRHAEKLEVCLETLGDKPSMAKETLSSVAGNLKALSEKMYEDELVKNALSDYATEHFEIACYKSLAAGARHAGLIDVVAVAEEILRDEERMAQWLGEKIPGLTNRYLDEAERKSA